VNDFEGASMASETAQRLLDAARTSLLESGFASFSTRSVADVAGMPLSQIHYHFGGKDGLVLALLKWENERLVERQRQMYASDLPLSARYLLACDFLDEDVESNYVRVLQEMLAMSWSHPAVATEMNELIRAWIDVLRSVLTEAEDQFGSLGPFTATELATLVGSAFLGGEALILLDDALWGDAVRGALRRVGEVIALAEPR